MEMESFWTNLSQYMTKESLDIGLYRIVMEECGSLASEPTDVTYDEVKCPGTVRPAIWCKPHSSSPSKLILYLHGGAFISGSPASHRKIAAHLAKKAGTYALVLDYRRAPEHQFPKQIEDVIATYEWLLNDRGLKPHHIAFAGDSAGGNLSVSASLAIKQRGLPIPAAIAAFSAWLDMRASGETYERNNHKDALASPEALPGVIKTYLGDAPLDNPLVDLLRTDLTGIPAIYIATGTSDILESDAVSLAENARKAGVGVQLELPPDMQHIWIALAGNSPEADRSLSEAAAFIISKMSD
ncbi:unnamed protein product [Clonostachys rhizophaga]|uniref:Alpha/beta hydrolase fold-3 domain-containing protein n=1 Tax=Clonostachys rhizophaga TaxID=160324 RepID=A0A9N9VVW2_9HYPO|nr:unnamed protein product [Clonostachys rhizophaga]